MLCGHLGLGVFVSALWKRAGVYSFIQQIDRYEMISFENVSYCYDKVKTKYSRDVLKGISFRIREGEKIGLAGANGVGKSTLLKLIVGLLDHYEGRITVDGILVEHRNYPQVREKAAYVFQDSDSQLFMNTVYEDVAFAPRNYGRSPEEVEKRTMDALRAVHMEEKKECQIYRLSGGEKKLAAIATVLSMEPEVLLMDEPSVALDPQNRRNLIHILKELPVAQVIASHDLDFLYDTCDRILVLSDGKLVADGTPDQVLLNEERMQAYGLELPLSFSRRDTSCII